MLVLVQLILVFFSFKNNLDHLFNRGMNLEIMKERRQGLAKFLQIVHQYLEDGQELVKAVHEQKAVHQGQEGRIF